MRRFSLPLWGITSGLVALVLFGLLLGCGGGGGIGDDLTGGNQTTGFHITGSVVASQAINAAIEPALRGTVPVGSCTIYLEDLPNLRGSSDLTGRFDLSPVPAGIHRVVVVFTNARGQFKARSGSVTVSEQAPEGRTGNLEMQAASARASGVLLDSSGRPIVNATLKIWGEPFTTDSQGRYETPLLPAGTTGTIEGHPAGFQPVSLELSFDSPLPPYIQTTVPGAGETNRPPRVGLRPDLFSVPPGGTVQLFATAADPDGQTLSYSWDSTSGTLTPAADRLSATWIASSQGGVATITFQAADPAGFKGRVEMPITVQGPVGDTTPPSVAAVAPASGTTEVSLSTTITVTFSEPVAPTSVTTGSFRLLDGAAPVAGSISVTGPQATLTPSAPLTPGRTYSVQLGPGVTDLAGNHLAPLPPWTFTTATLASDTLAPTVLSVFPPEGSGLADVSTVVSVTFSEAIDAASIGSATFTLRNGTDLLAGSLGTGPDGRTATFTPLLPLSSGTMYTATVGTGVVDLAGNPLAATKIWSFTTRGTDDTVPPTVVAVEPAENALHVPLTATLTVVFSEPMDPTSLPGAIHLASGTVPVPGTLMIAPDRTSATFHPTANLVNGTQYFALVGTQARDLAGNPLSSPKVWGFITETLADATPPAILSTLPGTNQTDVPVGTEIRVFFNEKIDPTSVTPSTFQVGRLGTQVPGDILVDPSLTLARFLPRPPLEHGQSYSVFVSSEIRDLAGNLLVSPRMWSFTTVAAVDTAPPTVASVDPPDGALNVGGNSVVVIGFSEPVRPQTLSTSSFQLLDGAVPVPGSVGALSDTAAFQPAAPLAPGRTYTVRVASTVLDLAGNAMGVPFSSTFTTGGIADTAPPQVAQVNPADGAFGVAPNARITVFFNERIASGSVSAAAFFLTDGVNRVVGNTAVGDSSVSFQPSGPMGAGQAHTVTVGTGITDLAGNALAATFTSTFTVLATSTPVPAGYSSFGFPVTGAGVDVPEFTPGLTATLILVNPTASSLTMAVGASRIAGPLPSVSAGGRTVLARVSTAGRASRPTPAIAAGPALPDLNPAITPKGSLRHTIVPSLPSPSGEALHDRLRRIEHGLPRFSVSPPTISPRLSIRADVLGQSQTFNLYQFGDNPITVAATCRKVIPHPSGQGQAYFYLDDGLALDQPFIDDLSSAWAPIYTQDRQTFGNEPPAGTFNGVNLTDDITIFVVDSARMSGAAGFFFGGDLYSQSVIPESNQRKIFYISYDPTIPTFLKSTLAHEFQHMINFFHRKTRDLDEETWLDEAMAGYAEHVCGYGLQVNNQSKALQANQFFAELEANGLTSWDGTHADYGQAYLFGTWLGQKYGPGGGVAAMLAGDQVGTAAVALFTGEPFETVLSKWLTALYVNDYTAASLYGIQGIDLKGTYNYAAQGLDPVTLTGVPVTAVSAFPYTGNLPVAPDTARFLEFTGGDGSTLRLTFPAAAKAYEIHR